MINKLTKRITKNELEVLEFGISNYCFVLYPRIEDITCGEFAAKIVETYATTNDEPQNKRVVEVLNKFKEIKLELMPHTRTVWRIKTN